MAKQIIHYFTANKKYHRWYFAIVDRARDRNLDDYKERHHIIPRSLGGTNDRSNLVDLTFREHFLAHWLLVRMTEGPTQRKMRAALHWMCYGKGKKKRAATGWQYDVARRAAVDAQIGNKRPGIHTKEFKIALKKRMKGNKYSHHSDDVREKIRKANLGRKASLRTRIKMSESHKGCKQSPERIAATTAARWTEKHKIEMSVKLKGRKQSPEQIAAAATARWTEKERIRMSKRFKGKKRPDISALLKGKKRPDVSELNRRRAANFYSR